MCSFKSIYFVIFVLNLYKTNAQISDKRLCVDADCKEPVSLAKTLLRYSSPDPAILSFAPNQEVTIFSKEAGSETNLWGAEIKGKRGYIPKHLVREYKVFKKPKLLVDTELKKKSQVPVDKEKNLEPNKVQEAFEVVDGTTIYLPRDSINPSSTESPVLATAVPPSGNEGDQTEALKSVDNGKEKETAEKISAPESVVGNVLSTITNWINDDSNSEEGDGDVEDEEDDDEDEEDEEEEAESSEETNPSDVNEELQKENSILQKPENQSSSEKEDFLPQDLNSLHNLPSGVTVSPYSAEIGENVKADTGNLLPKQETKDVGTVPKHPVAPEIKTESKPETDQLEVLTSQQESTSASPSLPMPETKIAEVNEEKDTEKTTVDKNENSENIVTTEATLVEEEQLPFVDEVTPVPNTEQQVELETSNEATATQEIEENKNQDVTPPAEQSPDVSQKDSAENFPDKVQVPAEPSQQPVGDTPVTTQTAGIEQNQIGKEQGVSSTLPPLGGLFNSDQNPYYSNVVQDGKFEETKEVDEVNDVPNEETLNQESQGKIENNIDAPEGNSKGAETGKEEEEEQNLSEENSSKVSTVEESQISSEDSVEVIQDVHTEDIDPDLYLDDNSDVEIPKAEASNTEEGGGLFSDIISSFFGNNDDSVASSNEHLNGETKGNIWSSEREDSVAGYCDAGIEACNTSQQKSSSGQKSLLEDLEINFNSDIFLYLITTSISVIVFLFGYMLLDRNRREAPLVARINKLEKELLITLKENELLQEKGSGAITQEVDDVVEQLTQKLAKMQVANQELEMKVAELAKELEGKEALEEQLENLEKELETSTEVGMELNRIISEMLDPTNGSERLKENVEQLQRQLLEQKDTINTINVALKEKEAENLMLHGEYEGSKKRAEELQNKLDEMVDRVLKIEKEKDQQHSTLQNEVLVYQQKYNEALSKADILNNDIQILRVQLAEAQRQAEIKTKEYHTLKESLDKIKSVKNDKEALRSLLDSTTAKAELQQLKVENEKYVEQLQQEHSLKAAYEKKYQAVAEEVNRLHQKYEQADKEKVEANSRLEVLNNYFKKREAELQEELIKYKSIWEAKEGEATSTTERIKYMQEEIENYKAQNETLKQEIVSQEIELKSQISMLEKKVHENWVTARQTERKLEDARQEAAQLRNRLTLRERAINEQNRLQSPVEQNGELPLSPHPIDSPASPPLLYSGRDHITKSPPIPGLPPFLPPPPGAAFMPPPLHFMPPPPSMYPGDHRPPPLGRMSSPPLNSRYSPDSSAFSPYDRRSPSPPYDSEYGTSPPPVRGYSPYNSRDDRRDYKRPPHVRTNGRNMKGSVISSGSEHSNDSLDKINRKQSKMV